MDILLAIGYYKYEYNVLRYCMGFSDLIEEDKPSTCNWVDNIKEINCSRCRWNKLDMLHILLRRYR